MGKRSSFERIPRDFYPTPPGGAAADSHLRGVRTFAEPCCGDGALVRHLNPTASAASMRAISRTGRDALASDSYGGADAIITNPPWSRQILHPLIPLPANCPDVAAARSGLGLHQAGGAYLASAPTSSHWAVIWIPGSTYNGKDNAAWYRFDARHSAGPVFHPFRSALLSSSSRLCAQCSEPYRPHRSDSRFCSDACRQRAYADA